MRTECTFCGVTLDADAAGVYQWVAGWEQRRKEGGTHAIRLPERGYTWACPACIDARAAGLATQPPMFG